ncbi:hypothetical protein [Kibdelosporangium philippinense]|uniref:hypothetical protein n=1 Tax=Kibdelosporangium philippinense TaxID=211113 RepID=UPI00361A65E1
MTVFTSGRPEGFWEWCGVAGQPEDFGNRAVFHRVRAGLLALNAVKVAFAASCLGHRAWPWPLWLVSVYQG